MNRYLQLALCACLMMAAAAAAPIASVTLPTEKFGLQPLPQPTAAFVKFCKTDAAMCKKYIILDSEVAMIRFMDAPLFCIPDSALSSDEASDKQIKQIKNGSPPIPS